MRAQLPKEFQALIAIELPLLGPVQQKVGSYPQRFIHIFKRKRWGDIGETVTVVEILTPANKTPKEEREDYIHRQKRLLAAPINLVEIDLLRMGEPTIAARFQKETPATPYCACLHRAEMADGDRAGTYLQTWPIGLRDPLPTITVPLTPDYPDLSLDLQAALERIYKDGCYERGIIYTNEPDPPLAPDDAAWADALLREKGLRPG